MPQIFMLRGAVSRFNTIAFEGYPKKKKNSMITATYYESIKRREKLRQVSHI